jgi:restriction endonuclease
MDPVSLATITSAATNLGIEALTDNLGEAGKELWATIKRKLDWQQEPDSSELASRIAEKLHKDEELSRELVKLLQDQKESPYSSALVQNINADKVTLADTINIRADLS